MRRKKARWITPAYAVVGMLLLILDAKTAVNGARDGIEICLHTVIPSLFPFIVLSCLISNSMLGRKIPFMRCLGKLCGVPAGAESLLLLGLLGGYPIGAQIIADAYHRGQLDKSNAQRMLGFCNNAGPAFLLGMVGSMFSRRYISFILWGLHIGSALITGILLPGRTQETSKVPFSDPLSLPDAIGKAMKSIAGICGWVILFRILLVFFEKWLLHYLPPSIQVLVCGLCELSNGCIRLNSVDNEGVRFVITSSILAAGGLCVAMQTASVTRHLGFGMYFPGKLIQTVICFLMSICTVTLIFPGKLQLLSTPFLWGIVGIMICVLMFFILFRKKSGNLQTNDV